MHNLPPRGAISSFVVFWPRCTRPGHSTSQGESGLVPKGGKRNSFDGQGQVGVTVKRKAAISLYQILDLLRHYNTCKFVTTRILDLRSTLQQWLKAAQSHVAHQDARRVHRDWDKWRIYY
mmetsp:Transcript_14402/g.20987  ORF Transcript_14402/g.20987 Transcript_14402/m.20987 type:complete len:120 (-) Transcript_14402:81-440(-)